MTDAFNRWFDSNFMDPDGGSAHLPDWFKGDMQRAWDAGEVQRSEVQSKCPLCGGPLESGKQKYCPACGTFEPDNAAQQTRGSGAAMIENMTPEELAGWHDDANCNAGVAQAPTNRQLHDAIASAVTHRTYSGIQDAVREIQKLYGSPAPSAHQSPPLVRASDNSGQRDPSVMPDSGGGETLYAWPIGCRHPNSCNRHGECMYGDCVHLGKPIRASSLSSTHHHTPGEANG